MFNRLSLIEVEFEYMHTLNGWQAKNITLPGNKILPERKLPKREQNVGFMHSGWKRPPLDECA